MTAARFYSSTAGAVDLTAGITNVATSMTVSSTTGLPGTTPFTAVIDPGTSTEEICTVTNVSGTTLTIIRGVDGSSAQSHSASVGNVRHMATARDFREPQEHIGASAAVHGVTGSVVGTTDSQTLTNKTALAATAATSALVAKGAASQTAAIVDVQDSTGASIATVTTTGITMAGGSGSFNSGAGGSLYSVVLQAIASGTAVVAGIFKRFSAGSTADILQIQDQAGVVLSKFDSAGNLTAPAVTATGAVSAGSVVSTGAVSGTTGTFSGNVTAANFQSAQDAQQTATVGSITGAEVTLVTAPAVTGNGTKKFQITVCWPSVTSTVAGDTFEIRIKKGATQMMSSRVYVVPASSGVDGGTTTVTDVPAGSVTYSAVAIRIGGSGTGQVSAAATSPISIIVEQIA